MKLHYSPLVALLLGCLSGSAWSASPQDLARLGKDLTPVGAQKGGNQDGTIPAFAGNQAAPAGWAWGKPRGDFWPYRSEKPLFVIDASNVDKYADKLTPGQIQMLKQVKGYTMPVYPTHRECGLPDFVLENTKEGAASSAIGKDGWSLAKATLPGVPFPVPSTGIEVMWNWLMRYQSAGIDEPASYEYVSPRPGGGNPIIVRAKQIYYFPWGGKGRHAPQDNGGLQMGNYYGYTEPAALAGQGVIQRYYFDKDADSYYYFTGQRRVRRLPSYTYDSPLIGYENEYPADSGWVFMGNPDRFDWRLVGKKEIYVPYNNFAMQNFNAKLADATGPNAVNASMRRYELHRVWEIEGTVKSGVRHSTPKKVLYVDEDSWLVALGDDYDAQGKIWKEKENFVAPQWEIGACVPVADVFNDLVSGRYLLDQTVVGTGMDMKFFPPGSNDPRLTESYFTGENLGTISER
ncbi:DUF1329 domain-containing protein [Paraburkholderia sp. J63]|uniref:DUF1329 domain-containing protein n=1 Tax=Paraburkholderia sp. J63 TaxID=2805434 RepID=UPI002ABE4F5E|nr:DUF1329 domain-containing protein [Paraburkholderia sp. J63]